MSILSLLVGLLVIGVGLYLVNTVIPIDPKIKTIINAVVVLIVVIWLLHAFGVLSGPIPRLKGVG